LRRTGSRRRHVVILLPPTSSSTPVGKSRFAPRHPRQAKRHRRPQASETVRYASRKIDRRRVGLVTGRTAHLGHSGSQPDDLAPASGCRRQKSSEQGRGSVPPAILAKTPIAGVILRELAPSKRFSAKVRSGWKHISTTASRRAMRSRRESREPNTQGKGPSRPSPPWPESDAACTVVGWIIITMSAPASGQR